MAGRSPADDAVDRYMKNRRPPAPKQEGVSEADQFRAEQAGEKRYSEYNRLLELGAYRVFDKPGGKPQYTEETDKKIRERDGKDSQQDWSSYLGLYGLPADVLKEINSIFSKTSDIKDAVIRAQAYVRGTKWYGQTYPGIQEAMAKGLVRDERDYRGKMNDFAQVYRQYANRDVTPGEYANHLREGVSVDAVGRRFQGSALADTYGNDWQYAEGNFGEGRLTGEELTAYGRQAAGLDSPMGLKVQRRLQMAQERIKSVFSGQLATGQLNVLNQRGVGPDISR